jgi:hypothetical protein
MPSFSDFSSFGGWKTPYDVMLSSTRVIILSADSMWISTMRLHGVVVKGQDLPAYRSLIIVYTMDIE